MTSKTGGLPQLSMDAPTLSPAPVVSSDAAVAAWDRVADQAAGLATAVSNKVFGPDAENEGSNAVTRDADGKLTVAKPSIKTVLTGQTEAYDHAAQMQYLSQSQMDIRSQLSAMQSKFAKDPDGFRSGLDDLIASKVKDAPSEFQPALRAMADREGGAVYDDILNQKRTADIQQAVSSVDALQTQDANSLFGYAASGQLSSPQAQATLAQWKARIQALRDNPAFNLSQTDIDQRVSSFQSELAGAQFRGQAGDWLQKYGRQEAETRLEKAVNDPGLNLSEASRNRYLSEGLSEIRMREAANRDTDLAAQQQVVGQVDDAYAKALNTGEYQSVLSDDDIRKAYPKNPAHAAQIIERLRGAQDTYTATKEVTFATPQQLQDLTKRYNPANSPPAPVPKMSVGQAIFGQESSFGANSRPSIDGSSLGPMQIKPDTFNQYARPGENINNPTDNKAVGQRIIDDYSKRYNGDPARVAVAYFSGPGNVAPAGSATPYLHDYSDANGKSVSGYVSDVLNRMGSQSDFGAKERTYQTFMSAVQARQKALSSDPASYVLKNRSDIADAINAKDPVAIQTGVRNLLQVQSDLGAPSPQVLTTAQKNEIIGQFNSPPDASQKAQNMVGVLNGLEAQYGQYYPQVMSELSHGGKLPAEVVGLNWVKDDPGVAPRMANAVNTTRTALAKVVPDSGKLDTDVVKGLSGFNSSLRGFGGSQVASQMVQSTQLYAYQLVAEGVNPDDAATQAVHDMVGKNFNFADTYRVPTYIDQGIVARGVQVATRDITPENLEPYGASAKGMSTGDRQKLGTSVLQANGAWVTLPDNSGLALTWGPQSGYLQARDGKHQPIQYSWAQLTTLANAGRKVADPTSVGPTTVGGLRGVGAR